MGAVETTPWELARTGLRIGTCSWTDKTLTTPGLFYPKGTSSAEDRLRFYADYFPVVEVDATYYSLPSERNAHLWNERTPDDFAFDVKAFSLLTQHPTKPRSLPPDIRQALDPETAEKTNLYHRDLSPEATDEIWLRFLASLRPLADSGKLRAVLFQFPKWFLPGRANRDYLVECAGRLNDVLPGVACAVEFRNERWLASPEDRERTLAFLAEHGLPFVCIDMPQGLASSIPAFAATTASLAIVRFHGRKSETWDKRGVGVHERFGYDYDAAELAEWVPLVDDLRAEAREVHVLMNNCYRDYAVRSAQTMAQLELEHMSS